MAKDEKQQTTKQANEASELNALLFTLSDHIISLKCTASKFRRDERDAKTSAEIYEMEVMELEMKVDEFKRKMGG